MKGKGQLSGERDEGVRRKAGRRRLGFRPARGPASSISGKSSARRRSPAEGRYGRCAHRGQRQLQEDMLRRVQAVAAPAARPVGCASSALCRLERAGRSSEEDVVERGLWSCDSRRARCRRRVGQRTDVSPSTVIRETTRHGGRRAVRRAPAPPKRPRGFRRNRSRFLRVGGKRLERRQSDSALERTRAFPWATIRPCRLIAITIRESVRLLQVMLVRKTVTPFLTSQHAATYAERLAGSAGSRSGRRIVEEEHPRPMDERKRKVEAPLHPTE